MIESAIEPLRDAHIAAISRLHCDNLTGLLQKLGQPAINAFYRGAIDSPHAIGFVAIEAGSVTGFIFGATSSERLRREMLREHFTRTTGGVLLGLLRRPSLLFSLISSLFAQSVSENSGPASGAELTYLVVDREKKGAGLGRELVHKFSADMQKRGIFAYEVSVDADNTEAIGFYRRLGFAPVGEYSEFGIRRIRYRMICTQVLRTADILGYYFFFAKVRPRRVQSLVTHDRYHMQDCS